MTQKPEKPPSRCYATFPENIKLFLEKHGQHHEAAKHANEQVLVIEFDNRFGEKAAKIQYEDQTVDFVPRNWLKIGKGIRSVPTVGPIRHGSDIAGRTARAIKSGRTFRGR